MFQQHRILLTNHQLLIKCCYTHLVKPLKFRNGNAIFPTLNWACDCLFMLVLELFLISKRRPGCNCYHQWIDQSLRECSFVWKPTWSSKRPLLSESDIMDTDLDALLTFILKLYLFIRISYFQFVLFSSLLKLYTISSNYSVLSYSKGVFVAFPQSGYSSSTNKETIRSYCAKFVFRNLLEPGFSCITGQMGIRL